MRMQRSLVRSGGSATPRLPLSSRKRRRRSSRQPPQSHVTGAKRARRSAPSSTSPSPATRRVAAGRSLRRPVSTRRRSHSCPRTIGNAVASSHGRRRSLSRPPFTSRMRRCWGASPPSPLLVERKVLRRDVAGDLVDALDVVEPELAGVPPHDLLIGRFVDAVRLHVSLVIDDDVAVLPADLRELLDRDLPRPATDLRHLILSYVKPPLDQEFRHGIRLRCL